MKNFILLIIAVVVVGAALTYWYFSDRGRFTTEAEYTNLARSVSGNELLSHHDPAAILRFDPAYQYIGGQKFILYGVADTEQHFFVETTADDKLKSIFWIQFEAYLPNKPFTYNYKDSPLRLNIGDYEFYTDTDAFYFDPDKKRKRGTDGSMVRQFLASKGYSYPSEVAYARMVYLTDEANNKELMIIFMDDLAEKGLTAAELQKDGASATRWPDIEREHLRRVLNSLSMFAVETQAGSDARAEPTLLLSES